MDKVKVSICMSTYNRKEILLRTIQNVFEQSYNGTYELLIIDNGSTDGTIEILSNLASKYNHIKWTRIDSNDYIGAHNKILSVASGEYITWLDSDDMMSQNSIETLVNYLDNNKKVDVVSSLVMFNRNYAISNTINDLTHEQIVELAKSEQLNKICFFQSAMFRRKCLDIFSDGVYFYPEYSDGFCGQGFMYTLLFNNFKFANTRDCIYLYNLGQEKNSISATIPENMILFSDTINSLSFDDKKKAILDLFIKHNPNAKVVEEKPKRGRKKKEVVTEAPTTEAPKKRRGRPKKTEVTTEVPTTEAPKKRRGRPKKSEA